MSKCINGIIRPFTVDGTICIKPEIVVTVIASKASSLFRVLQEFKVTTLNCELLFEGLYDAMNEFVDSIPVLSVDKSGSICALLEYAIHFLDASDRRAMKSIVTITDGVAASCSSIGVLEYDYCKRIVKDFVAFNIIQIKSSLIANFGCVPDSEYLQSICVASRGHHIYDTECAYLPSDADDSVHKPNFYHNMLLIGRTALNRKDLDAIVDTSSAAIVSIDNRSHLTQSSTSTITTLESFTIHTYPVYAPALSQIITARLIDGFAIHSIRPMLRLNRAPKVEITLAMHCFTHVILFYKIRCYHWQIDGSSPRGQPKHPQIELSVLSKPQFVHQLLNKSSEQIKTRLYTNVEVFKKCISSIFESDMLLKQFMVRSDELKLLNFDLNSQDEQSLNSNLAYLQNIFENKLIAFEFSTLFVILRSSSFVRASLATQVTPNVTQMIERRQVAATFLLEYLSHWSTFTSGDHVYFKYEEDALIYLKVKFVNDFVVSIELSFVGMSAVMRASAITEISSDLDEIELSNRGTAYKPIKVCQRNIAQYILRSESDVTTLLDSYGVSRRMHWLSREDLVHIDCELILISAKQMLAYHRMSEGYTLIFETAKRSVFYREFYRCDITFASLIIIDCDIATHLLETRLWTEPLYQLKPDLSTDSINGLDHFSDVYELYIVSLADEIEKRDRPAMNRLSTFIRLRSLLACDVQYDDSSIGKGVDLQDTLRSSQINVLGFKVPSLSSNALFVSTLFDSIEAVIGIKIGDTLACKDIVSDIRLRLQSKSNFSASNIYGKLINNETIILLALPTIDSCSSDTISVITFIVQLPLTPNKTIIRQSSTAFKHNIPNHVARFSTDAPPQKALSVLLTGTYRHDANCKKFNTTEVFNSLLDAYNTSIVIASYEEIVNGHIASAVNIKNALDLCSDVTIMMDISDFLRLTPIDSSDVSFNAAFSAITKKNFAVMNDGQFYCRPDTVHAHPTPLFLSIGISLSLHDDHLAHFDVTTTDIGHIRESYTNFLSGAIEFKLAIHFCASVLPSPRNINLRFSDASISAHHKNIIEDLYVSIRKLLDEEILYSLLYKDLKSLSIPFVSGMISRLSDSLPIIKSASEVGNYIHLHPGMQTFSGRIEPVFIGDYDSCLIVFFVYFFNCKCFHSVMQLGDSHVLKYNTHDDATDLLDLNCDESLALKDDLYWLILSAKGTFLDIQFYARDMKTKSSTKMLLILLVNRVFRMVKKVNQKTLLHEMSESRRASKALIHVPVTVSKDESDDESDSSTTCLKNLHFYASGDLACPELLSHTLPVHWRLKTLNAINYIMVALQPLAVSNRHDMLIYSTDSSSYYIELTSSDLPAADQTLNVDSIRAALVDIEGERRSFTPEPPSRHASDKEITTPKLESYLLMKVHGVDPPDPVLKQKLIELIESRLVTLTMHTISIYLSRNLSSKQSLTQADIEFVLPVPKKATRSELIRLSNSVPNPHVLLLYLKQHLASYMSLLPRTSELPSIRNYFLAKFGLSTIDLYEEQRIGDVAFMYSAVSSRSPSPLEGLFGVGILSCVIVLLDKEQRVFARIPTYSPTNTSIHSMRDVAHSDDDLFLAVEVWSTGSIDLDSVFAKIRLNADQALVDYCIELNDNHSLSGIMDCTNEAVENVSSALACGYTSYPTSFFRLASEFFIPNLRSKDFIHDLTGIISECIPLSQSTVKAFDEPSCVTDIITRPSRHGKPLNPRATPKRGSPIKSLEDSDSETSLNIPARVTKRVRSSSLAPLNMSVLDNNITDSMIISGFLDLNNLILGQRCFIMNVNISESSIVVHTYNLAKVFADKLFGKIVELISWNEIYSQYLETFSPGLLSAPQETLFSSSYNVVYNYVNLSRRLNERKALVDPGRSQHSFINARASNKIIKAFQSFLLGFVWSNRSQIPELAKTANSVVPFVASDALSRTPRSQSMLFSDIDGVSDRYTLASTALLSTLRTVKIEDIFKYPLLFSQKRNELFDVKIPTRRFTADERKFKMMLTQWDAHFSAYLYYLGYAKLNSDGELSETVYDAHDELQIKTDVVYFTQEVVGGTVFVQVAVDGIFASLNIYSLVNQSTQATQGLIGQLKRIIHFHSLAYDFHARIIQQVLDAQISPAVFSVNIINVLSAFVTFNAQNPPLARCRVVHQKLYYEELGSLISTYIFSNPEKYGFKPLYHNDDIIACYITSSSPLFLQSSVSQSSFTHTIIVYSTTLESGQVELSCFIILLDAMNLFPNSEVTHTPQIKPDADEYIHSGYYMQDIIKNGIKQVDEMIAQAKQSYTRDTLWQEMLAFVENGRSGKAPDQIWSTMLIEKLCSCSKSITTLNRDMLPLFSDHRVPCPSILDHLGSKYDSLTFQDSSHVRHLIIPNRKNTDYILHFYFTDVLHQDRLIVCDTVSREDIYNAVESDLVDIIATEICVFLFSQSCKTL